jgi:hypothetical protein
MGLSFMVTDIAEQSLPEEQLQMIRVLIKRMLMETDPERLKMFAEQIRRITAGHRAMEQCDKAA